MKLIVWGKNNLELPLLAKSFMQKITGISVVSADRGWTLEVTNINATKAQGNLWAMKNLFKINDPNLCCHIGDTMNDFPVIGTLGFFLAPLDAQRSFVKRPLDAQKDLLLKAPYLTVAHDQGAVSEVMNGNFWENPWRLK